MTIAKAVVTGAGSGLGRAIALRVARPGATLVLADLNLAACEETAQLARARGATAHALAVDVADAAQVEALAADAEGRLGRIDLVVNNAGVAVAGAIGQAPLDDWRWIIGINLFGVIHGCHAFVPRLVAQGGGAILNTASMAGFACAPMMGAYNVTKAGVIALSETLAAELADKHVRVTVLCPAFFKTNLLQTARSVDPQLMVLARGAFERATMSADDVAAAALRAVERGKLYCLPMREGRVIWRIKRLLPERFVKILSSQRLQRLARSE
jgi:NAD(P)-dependent dehydrogenase (short-subunit alcohol dehydrogenase family)